MSTPTQPPLQQDGPPHADHEQRVGADPRADFSGPLPATNSERGTTQADAANALASPEPRPRAPHGLIRVLVLLTALGLTEGVLRLANHVHPFPALFEDGYNRLRGVPHAPHFDSSLNSAGFNDGEFPSSRSEGTERIVAIGDGFAFGAVPRRFNHLTLLENALRRDQRPAEVLNLGIPGTGPRDYLSILVREAFPLRPDRVLIYFSIGDDFVKPPPRNWLLSASYLARLVRAWVAPTPAGGGSTAYRWATYDDSAPAMEVTAFLALEHERSKVFRMEARQLHRVVERATRYLAEIARRCAQKNVALTVVLIPDVSQVDPVLRSRLGDGGDAAFDSGGIDWTQPNELLAAALAGHGIAVIDLRPEFAKRGAVAGLHRPNDTAWNVSGNRMAAGIVAREVFGVRTRPGPRSRVARTVGAPPPPSPTPAHPAPLPVPAFEGFHDLSDCRGIRGWAWDPRRTNESIEVDVLDGEVRIATVTANQFRQDLLDAGKGTGAHAFDLPLPGSLRDGRAHNIRLRIAGTAVDLSNTPNTIWCPAQ